MRREYRDYLDDIRHSIQSISSFTKDMTADQFRNDEKTVYAVIRAFEIIGEAATKIPDDYRSQHPEMPWKEMGTMRNKLIHEYFGVNLDVLWKTVQEDIPKLKQQIENLF